MVERHETRDGSPRCTRRTRRVHNRVTTGPNVPLQDSEQGRSSSSTQLHRQAREDITQSHIVRTNNHRPRSNTTTGAVSRPERSTSKNGPREHSDTVLGIAPAAVGHEGFGVQSVGARSNDTQGRTSGATVEYLDELIDERMVKSAAGNDGSRFMPIDQLDNTISPANVQQELDIPENRTKIIDFRIKSSGHGHSNIESVHLANIICQTSLPRRKIFAILCFIRKAYAILSFIDEGISDRDLPFDFGDDLRWDVSRKVRDGNSRRSVARIALFTSESWTRHELDSFRTLQWRFLAPYIPLSYELGQSSRPLDLPPLAILPFIEDKPEAPDLSQFFGSEGGFSFVRKVQIHPAHHNHWKNLNHRGSSYFAVKELKTRPAQGHREVRSLMRFNEQPHEHLIRLLATFVHRDSLHMIFHWADGNNLEKFWMNTPAKPQGDVVFTRWMSKQISGLAQAIHRIHHCDDSLLPLSDRGKTHGRHGDIKPENILWFKHDPNDISPESFGILKISDFGLAEFRGPRSKSNIPASQVVGFSNAYRAPEFDVIGRISPRYDIWSFGCVLLEFAVWRTLDGYEGGVNPFSVSRTKESTAIIGEDGFFNLSLAQGEEYIEAKAKPSVIEIFRKLRNHRGCTGFIRDLLQCIELDLLQLEPHDRATCGTVVEKLQAIDEQCKTDQEYCTKKARIVNNKTPIGLQKPVPLSLSKRMREELDLGSKDRAVKDIERAMPNQPFWRGNIVMVLIVVGLFANLIPRRFINLGDGP